MCEVHKSSAERERIEGRNSGLSIVGCLSDCAVVEVSARDRTFRGQYIEGVMDTLRETGYEAAISRTDGVVYHLSVNRRVTQNA